MGYFLNFLKEEAEAESSGQLKHIHHAEDRPLMHGKKGYEHAVGALNQAHEHTKEGLHNSNLTMKYDGSPSIVFGHHPKTGKFFVASKSAFNKTPKINYNHADILKNHGHAPGLVDALHAGLTHLPKVTPKHGVYQGDVMFKHDTKHESKKGVSFTPNTITYTAKGDGGDKIRKAKFGVVVHQQYHGDNIATMKADPHPDHHNFSSHPDVWHKSAEHDTKQVHYSPHDQEEFHKHMAAAKEIHDKNKNKMYKATEMHQGEGGRLATYINHTVRTDENPTSEGLKNHIQGMYNKASAKLKTPAAQSRKSSEAKVHMSHIDKNKEQYDNILKMHHHLQKAKDTLVNVLNQHPGGLEHHIDGKATDPEGFVVNHENEPTKLVNRKEFAKANLLKVRK